MVGAECRRPLFVFLIALIASHCVTAQQLPISLYVDATDSVRKLFHSELTIPAHPGPLTLVYPRWAIPTDELPVTALNNIVRLKISSNGRTLEWKRDLVDKFSFHVVVPNDSDFVKVTMDVVAPADRTDLNAATGQLLILDWYTLVLYPQEAVTNEVLVDARLRLPPGWQYASAITPAKSINGVIEFPRISLATLSDSPVIAGKYIRTLAVPLHSGPPVFVDIAADTPDAAELSSEWQTRVRRIIAETGVLFGGYPYQQYHFLLTLSDEVGNDGLEHRQSSDIRMSLRSFSEDGYRLSYGYLLPHEYVHSWNAKYRMPAGLVTRNFQQPQTTELLWVYEGLTRYLNWVLAARSGIFSPQEARDYVALLAAQVAERSGREWRSLQDTAVSAGMLNAAPEQWQSLRRGVDYYDESLFIWLEADTIIRRESNGQHSLDDFCRSFFGPPKNPPDIKPYTFDDVVVALNEIVAHDWRDFFQTRLNSTSVDNPSFGGLFASGWKLIYEDTPGSVQVARDKIHHTVEERFSLGLLLKDDGTIVDVVRDSPAWNAGLGPDMKIVAVSGHDWSPQSLHDAIAHDRGSNVPLSLSVQNGLRVFQADVHDDRGTRYPQLERSPSPDLMRDILASRTPLVPIP
jgi:predicted metalloprotease with PDZ domain